MTASTEDLVISGHLTDLPSRLLSAHRTLDDGARLRCRISGAVELPLLEALLQGGGFRVDSLQQRRSRETIAEAIREPTLPDYVQPGLRLLVCGLNPSPYAAQTGIPFGRPGNRFWPAAVRAGLLERERDPDAALASGVGFTDIVKRVTRAAAEIDGKEYRAGTRRLELIVGWLRPAVICFVGLGGVREVFGKQVTAGWLGHEIGQARAYVMPSTSGRNARTSAEELAHHLRRAAGAVD